MGFPSPLTPSNVYLKLSPSAATVRVRLFGVGPGSYFDFSTFSFQVPTIGLLCACAAAAPTTAKTAIATIFTTCFMCDPPWVFHRSTNLLFLLRETYLCRGPWKNDLRHTMPHRIPSQITSCRQCPTVAQASACARSKPHYKNSIDNSYASAPTHSHSLAKLHYPLLRPKSLHSSMPRNKR